MQSRSALRWQLGAVARGPGDQRPTTSIHPHQDVGDNFDLIAAYALPEVDLRAVIFDVTDEYRKPVGQVAGLPADKVGPREPGYLAVEQLNRIFDRAVPCASAPFGNDAVAGR